MPSSLSVEARARAGSARSGAGPAPAGPAPADGSPRRESGFGGVGGSPQRDAGLGGDGGSPWPNAGFAGAGRSLRPGARSPLSGAESGWVDALVRSSRAGTRTGFPAPSPSAGLAGACVLAGSASAGLTASSSSVGSAGGSPSAEAGSVGEGSRAHQTRVTTRASPLPAAAVTPVSLSKMSSSEPIAPTP